ncbi:alpha/beta fold hydrolase [Pseudonocardia nantongensis]|uniref:alpha/beta fold hydrolase n=1 Tax=Pseudonocardia nantongensis TaxID=1181885 RepID=UPI00397E1D9E
MPGSLVGVVMVLRPEGASVDIYRSDRGRTAIHAWCADELDGRLPSADRRVVDSPLGPTHLTTSGSGPQDLVLLPGTNMNAATSIPVIRALAGSVRVTVADLPGQPGLSAGERPQADLVDGYRAWLDHVLAAVGEGPVLLAGESRGAAVALCASPGPKVGGLLLAAPAGLVVARLTPGVLRASVPWLLRPTPARSARMLATMYGEGVVADHDQLVDWMALVARHVRSSLSPSPLPERVVAGWHTTPCQVLVGEHDRFFTPGRVRPAAAGLLQAATTTVPGGGHLLSHTSPDAVAAATSRGLGSMWGR